VPLLRLLFASPKPHSGTTVSSAGLKADKSRSDTRVGGSKENVAGMDGSGQIVASNGQRFQIGKRSNLNVVSEVQGKQGCHQANSTRKTTARLLTFLSPTTVKIRIV